MNAKHAHKNKKDLDEDKNKERVKFLIGKMQTIKDRIEKYGFIAFQFLIGKMQTELLMPDDVLYS